MRLNTRTTLACVLTACVLISPGRGPCFGAQAKEAFLSAQEILDAWLASYGDISSLKYHFTQVNEHFEGPPSESPPPFYHVEKTMQDDSYWARSTRMPKGFARDDGDSHIVSFNGRLGKEYVGGLKRGKILASKGSTNLADDPRTDMLKASLGLSSCNLSFDWLKENYPNGLTWTEYDFIKGLKLENLRVLPGLESVAGQMCHVVEIDNLKRDRRTKYWFAHQKNMLMVKKHEWHRSGSWSKMTALGIASVQTEVGDFWYISELTRELKSHVDQSLFRMHIHEFVPRIEVPMETFNIEFPGGTWIQDNVAGRAYRTPKTWMQKIRSWVEP